VPGEGPWYRRYRDLARQTGVPLLASLVELDRGRRYNTACLIDGHGEYRGKYRKVHATLGEQAWWGWSKGQGFKLLELDGVRYGVSICADMSFPETVRCQELLGADVILHQSIGDDMGRIVPTRAFDSKLPIVMSIFQGGSYAVDAGGNLLGKLPANKAGWKMFDLRPFRTHLGRKFGGVFDEKKTIHNMRNPGAYSILVDPSTRPPWTEVFMDDQGRPQTREQLLKRFEGHYDADDPAAGAPTSSPAGQ
jgi:predicted amidohydrolase